MSDSKSQTHRHPETETGAFEHCGLLAQCSEEFTDLYLGETTNSQTYSTTQKFQFLRSELSSAPASKGERTLL